MWIASCCCADFLCGAAAAAPAAVTAAGEATSPAHAGVAARRRSQTLTVRRAWSRATAPGATVGVVYFDIVNAGAADELLAIESPAAPRVEMHATTRVGGMMEMRQEETVAVPAAGRVTFQPGGLHAMLMDIKQPLIDGAHISLTLVFKQAGRVATQALVQSPGAMSGPADGPPVAGPAAAANLTATNSTGGAGAAPADTTRIAYRLTNWPPHAATPDFALDDADGHSRTLADYRGRVVVLFFGFVHCPDVCPAELFKLALVMKQLGATAARIQVLFVTLDPARDTRRVLKGYVTAFDPRFVGLRGSAPQIDRAAGNFYVEYARVPAGAGYTIDHSTSTFVLDAGGRLRLIGTTAAAVADYAHDLELLAAE